MNKLAIVIPAYKGKFFNLTLESIANQTCKDFVLYIGDDASPDNLENIVNQYTNKINICYHRFLENLGGKDLVAHWERCVDLIKYEDWIWFFSDDDVVSEDCVEGFYEILKKHQVDGNLFETVFRFCLVITDKDLNPLQEFLTPDYFSIEYFLEKQFISHTLVNRAVEFIFSKSTFYAKNGFVNFPLAWGSDKATILKLAYPKGFCTIPKGKVFWRSSELNISGNSDKSLNELKAIALNKRNQWMLNFIMDFQKHDFFYSLVYRIMHNITLNQAFDILKKRRIVNLKLRLNIFLIGIFIIFKKLVKFKHIKKRFQKSGMYNIL